MFPHSRAEIEETGSDVLNKVPHFLAILGLVQGIWRMEERKVKEDTGLMVLRAREAMLATEGKAGGPPGGGRRLGKGSEMTQEVQLCLPSPVPGKTGQCGGH